jgi:hypothetical protein
MFLSSMSYQPARAYAASRKASHALEMSGEEKTINMQMYFHS